MPAERKDKDRFERRELSDFDVLNEALKGITGVYFVYPIHIPGILEATALFAEAALTPEVGVYRKSREFGRCKIALHMENA